MATQLAGEDILASDIATPKYVKKAATETVTASATLQDDNDFNLIPLAANKVYRIEGRFAISISALGTGDYKQAWVFTGGATLLTARFSIGSDLGTTDPASTMVTTTHTNPTTSTSFGVDDAGATIIMQEFLAITTTVGTLTLQWAQNTANGTTSLSGNSYLIITEIEAMA